MGNLIQIVRLCLKAREPLPGQLEGLVLGISPNLKVDTEYTAVAWHKWRGNAQLKPVGSVMGGKV